MELNGKNIVITGATSGIGFSLVAALSRKNCNICAVGRNQDKLNSLNKRYPSVYTILCDISIKENIDILFETLYTKTKEWPGKADVFIANAGFAYYESFSNASWEHIEDIYNVNVFSPFYSLSKMMEYSGGKRFQYVIVASGVSLIPLPGYSLYSSTKGAVRAFAKAFIREGHKNVILSVVYPVAIKTAFYKKEPWEMKVPLIRQSVKNNALGIIKGIEENKKAVYPSNILKLYVIFSRFLPLERMYTYLEGLRLRRWLK